MLSIIAVNNGLRLSTARQCGNRGHDKYLEVMSCLYQPDHLLLVQVMGHLGETELYRRTQGLIDHDGHGKCGAGIVG